METTKVLKIAFTGKKFIPTRTSAGKLQFSTGSDPKILGSWDSKTYTKTFSIDENFVQNDLRDADPETGEVSPEAYERIYNVAKGLIVDGLVNLNGITPIYLGEDYAYGSPLQRFYPDVDVDKQTQVSIYWEVKNILPIVSE